MKEIKLSFQWHLQFYDRTLFAPYREQKLQLGPIYPTLPYILGVQIETRGFLSIFEDLLWKNGYILILESIIHR